MARTVLGSGFLATLIGALVSGLPAAAQPPAQLPPLPPPSAALPPLPPPEPAPKPKPQPVTRVPVELRVSIADLEKHILRLIVQKLDPKAEPVLPFVVRGNEKEYALGKDAAAKEAGKDGGPPDVPKPVAEADAKDKGADGQAVRPQLIPRPPGARPRLDRLAGRPAVAAAVDRLMATFDLTYRIELRSLKIAVAGNTLTCEVGGGFHCESKGAGPVPPPAALRDIGIKMLVTKNLEWSANGKLELKEGSTKVWIDPDAPLIGFPRLDVERVVRLNGFLATLNSTLDRELMTRFTGEGLPDLAVLAPTVKPAGGFLSLAELTAYPIRGDDKHVYFAFEVGLIGSNKKTMEAVAVSTSPGPVPEPQVRGTITFDKDGKPVVKIGR
jgi:hypothetical protein